VKRNIETWKEREHRGEDHTFFEGEGESKQEFRED